MQMPWPNQDIPEYNNRYAAFHQVTRKHLFGRSTMALKTISLTL
jgi:hypothetical protein